MTSDQIDRTPEHPNARALEPSDVTKRRYTLRSTKLTVASPLPLISHRYAYAIMRVCMWKFNIMEHIYCCSALLCIVAAAVSGASICKETSFLFIYIFIYLIYASFSQCLNHIYKHIRRSHVCLGEWCEHITGDVAAVDKSIARSCSAFSRHSVIAAAHSCAQFSFWDDFWDQWTTKHKKTTKNWKEKKKNYCVQE